MIVTPECRIDVACLCQCDAVLLQLKLQIQFFSSIFFFSSSLLSRVYRSFSSFPLSISLNGYFIPNAVVGSPPLLHRIWETNIIVCCLSRRCVSGHSLTPIRQCCLPSSSTNLLAASRSNAVHSVSPMAFIISCIGFSITLFVFASPLLPNNVCIVSFLSSLVYIQSPGNWKIHVTLNLSGAIVTALGTCGMRSARDTTLVYFSRQGREMFCICLSQRKILVFHLNAHASCERWIEGNLYIRECRQWLLQHHSNYSFRRSHTAKKREFSAFPQRVFFTYLFIASTPSIHLSIAHTVTICTHSQYTF